MKIAVFSDVHANLIALKQFVKATHDQVDGYLCLGDVVNYGPWNDECLEIVTTLPGITFLEGNHEALYLGKEKFEDEIPLVQAFSECSKPSFSRIDLITDLPQQCELGTFNCHHTIDEIYIYENTPIEVTSNILIGHTHHQFLVERSGFLVVNPGSVGQNRKYINILSTSLWT